MSAIAAKVIWFVLQRLAKQSMSEAEYLAFQQRKWVAHLNHIRENFPDIWHEIMAQIQAVQNKLGDRANADLVVAEITQGGINQYPELFEYFRLRKYEVLPPVSEVAVPVDVAAVSGNELPPEMIQESDVAGAVTLEPPTDMDGGCAGLLGALPGMLVEMLTDFSGS